MCLPIDSSSYYRDIIYRWTNCPINLCKIIAKYSTDEYVWINKTRQKCKTIINIIYNYDPDLPLTYRYKVKTDINYIIKFRNTIASYKIYKISLGTRDIYIHVFDYFDDIHICNYTEYLQKSCLNYTIIKDNSINVVKIDNEHNIKSKSIIDHNLYLDILFYQKKEEKRNYL